MSCGVSKAPMQKKSHLYYLLVFVMIFYARPSEFDVVGVIITLLLVKRHNETRSTRRAQTSLVEADHYSHITHGKNVEPWW